MPDDRLSDQTTLLRPGTGVPTEGPFEGDRYRDLDELGVGGCGRVMRAWDRRLRRVVAHKRVHAGSDALRELLVREARLLAYLDHPGVVQVYDVGDEDYTMRMLEGDPLKERLRRGPLPIGEAVRILTRVAEALASVHAKGVMHLDIKPANIILQPYGHVSVIDWGVAQFHDRDAYLAFLEAVGEAELTEEGAMAPLGGTPAYMPVEQAVGEGVGPTADVFACGTVLYEMLTGTLPFPDGGGTAGVIRKAVVRPDPPSTHRADVPARLDGLCLRMLSPNPEARPADFTDVLAELRALSGSEGEGEVLELAPGDVLCREGEPGHTAYLVLSGELRTTIDGPDGPVELRRHGTGELIGELAIVSQAPRSATVAATVPTRVAVVTETRLQQELDRTHPLITRMVRSLSDRLREEAARLRSGDDGKG
jgi:CRP-like cAMP-binding protein/predicted Ser/Thr protein kinase